MDRWRGSGCYACDETLDREQHESTCFGLDPDRYRCHKCRCSLLPPTRKTPTEAIPLEPHLVIWDHIKPLRLCLSCQTSVYVSAPTTRLCWVCATPCNPKERSIVINIDQGAARVRYTACTDQHFDELLTTLVRQRVGWCSKCNLLHSTAQLHAVQLQVSRRRRKDASSWFDTKAWNTWLHSWTNPAVIWEVDEYTTGMKR